MTVPPAFFLPDLSDEIQEDAYAFMASKYGRAVPALGHRIYSISFVHDGTLWTATVGQHLKSRKLAWPEEKSTVWSIVDAAVVLAIFPGDPYCIVTDSEPNSDVASPIYAAEPTRVENFFYPKRRG